MKADIKDKTKYWIFGVAFIIVAGFVIFLMIDAYKTAKDHAVERLYEQEKMLAVQTKRGIESYFEYIKHAMSTISQIDEIVSMTDQGKQIFASMYNSQNENLSSITRVDSNGTIMYAFPNSTVTGRNIAYQEHVKQFLTTKKPVVSSVFTAVQGYKAIAFHLPIFSKGKFCGSISVLIPFEKIVKHYLKNIKIGTEGYAFLIDSKGIELYCPVQGHTGESIFVTSKEFPDVIAMAKEMIKGNQGQMIYYYNRVKNNSIDESKKHAYYMPIRVGETIWSLCISATEADAVLFVRGFRNSLALSTIWLSITLILFGYMIFKVIVKVERDKTEIKAQAKVLSAETERENAKALLDAAVMQSPVGIIIIDAKTFDIILTNKAAIEIKKGQNTNLSNDDLKHFTPSWALKTKVDGVSIHENAFPLYRAVHKSEIIKNEEFLMIDDIGKIKFISINASPIKNQAGEVIAAISIINDISEIKHNEDARAKLETQLIQAQKMESIGRLAGGVAHDFNNMLTPILGYTELMLLEAEPNGANKRRYEEIIKAVTSSRDLVRQLLAFARRQNLELKSINLNMIIDDLRNIVRRTIRENVKIEYKLTEHPYSVKADIGQIEQIIMNLAVNAQDAMPDGGHLFIETSLIHFDFFDSQVHQGIGPGKYCQLTISDTGHGMDSETQSKIFEPFFSTKQIGHGTGLGLATVHGIIKQHGGHISLYSEINKGSSFRLYFPIVSDTNVEPERSIETRIKGMGKETILVVEDQDQVREMATEVLESCGYKVFSAESANTAIELFKTIEHIDILVTDVILPDINGRSLYEGLIKQQANLKVLFMSGYTADVLSRQGEKFMEFNFIQKPFSVTSFSEKVREILDS